MTAQKMKGYAPPLIILEDNPEMKDNPKASVSMMINFYELMFSGMKNTFF